MSERWKHHLTIGKALYELGELDDALKYLVKVMDVHKSFADVHNLIGIIFHRQGRLHEAKKALETAMSINPGYAEAALNLSVVYNDLGLAEQGINLYRKVQRLARRNGALDSHVRGKLANLHKNTGDAYRSANLFEEALAEYEKALALGPAFPDLCTSKGLVLAEMGRREESVEIFEQVVEKNPGYLDAMVHLGVSLFVLAEYERSADTFRKVQRVDPGNRMTLMYLTLLARRLGRKAENEGD